MKLTKYFSLCFLIGLQFVCYGQTQSGNQSLQINAEAFTKKMIHLITQKDYAALNKLTTPKVYCYLCFEETPGKNAFIKKDVFYTQHAGEIFNKDLIERLDRNEIKFSYDGSDPGFKDRDYIVLYTTYRPNEFGDGHEGAQFVFWLKEEKGNFKLSGIETIP
ncbi:hypothetical protein QWZ06_05725 [Chryseobacterium tructae]|uniref:DUF4440 domain-containing protein n=1 Tax=Chryseobacterium tructae TaxID=1037380 RepID=A0ABV7XSU4_9FLAO|nr:hypothetical protein [Chryseobacterium tructae]MDN3691785.1 hypothetical protein [Chryseobacterium tructae]